MADSYFSDQIFQRSKKIQKGDYENCRFVNCILPKSDLSGINFIECEFENCDISSSKLYDTSFNEVLFRDSKLVGLRFEDCNHFLFSILFEGCNLNLSSFYQLKPKNISFRNCNLKEADFIEADLADTVFDHCNLESATFAKTNLESADFHTSFNYSIDPETNSIQKAKFSIQGLPGLLEKYDLELE